MSRNTHELLVNLHQTRRRSSTDWTHELMAILFAPLVRILQRINVSPNTVTFFGFALSLVGGIFLALGYWGIAAVVIATAGLLDGVDGLLARQSQKTSRFGAFLDSVLDRWSESAFFVGLLIWYSRLDMKPQEVLVIVALASSLLVSYTRARAEGIGAQCRRGLFTRFERFIALIAGLVLKQMTIALCGIAVLSTFTAAQRIYTTWRYIMAEHKDQKESTL